MLKRLHPYAWLWEPLTDEPTFLLRPMFGTQALYLDGLLMLCFSARKEPWHGVLVGTERQHHDSLLAAVPALGCHPILPKWLYLPDSAPGFEAAAQVLVDMVRKRDPRIGVIPSAKRRRGTHDRP